DQRGHAADRRARRRLRRSEGQGARGSLVGLSGRRDDGARHRAGRAAAARALALAGAVARHRGAAAAEHDGPVRAGQAPAGDAAEALTELLRSTTMRTTALTIAALLTSASLAAAQGAMRLDRSLPSNEAPAILKKVDIEPHLN